MTIEKSETTKLFRRPRKPNLERVDLNIERAEFDKADIADSDEYDEDDSSATDDSSASIVVKFPPLQNKYGHDQLISIVEESTINESPTHENMRSFELNSKPNSSLSPKPFNKSSLKKHYNSRASGELMRMSLMKPYKPLGPDPLPPRQPRLHAEGMRERKLYYQTLSTGFTNPSYNDNFDLNDFLLDSRYNQRLVASCVKNISKYTYSQMCRLLEAQIEAERNKYLNQVDDLNEKYF